jgi:hypothetical protein
MMVHVLADNSNPTAKLHIKYAHDYNPAAWSVMHTDLNVPINVAGGFSTAWLPLPTDAKSSDVWLRAETVGGSTVSLTIVSVTVSFR